MKSRQSERTVTTLANASELVLRVSQGILGNEVADSLNGSPISEAAIHNLAQSKFQAAVAPYLAK